MKSKMNFTAYLTAAVMSISAVSGAGLSYMAFPAAAEEIRLEDSEIIFDYDEPRYCYSYDEEEFEAYSLFGDVYERCTYSDGSMEEKPIVDQIDFAGLSPAKLYEDVQPEEGTVYSCKVPFYYNGELITDAGPDVYVCDPGDVNLDGDIDMSDVAMVLDYCACRSAGLEYSASDIIPDCGDLSDELFMTLAAANEYYQLYKYWGQQYEARTEVGFDDAQAILKYMCMEYASLEPEWKSLGIPEYDGALTENGVLEIGAVEVSVDELIAADYRVSVPVTIRDIDSWSGIEFGFLYDPQMVMVSGFTVGEALMDAKDNGDAVLMCSRDNYADNLAWVSVAANEGCGSEDADIREGVVCYIDVIVWEDVKSGDMAHFDMMTEGYDGNPQKLYSDYREYCCQTVSGYIYITEGSTGTTTTTTTTATTTTTTTTTATTTVTTTTTESTTAIPTGNVCGDVNLDGIVSMVDMVYLNKYLADMIIFNEQQLAGADCVSDGSITGSDASALLRFLVRLVDVLPVTI